MTTSKYPQYVRNTDQWINYSFINYQLNLLKKKKSKKWTSLDHTQVYADNKIKIIGTYLLIMQPKIPVPFFFQNVSILKLYWSLYRISKISLVY